MLILLLPVLQCNLQEKPDGVHPRLEKYVIRKAFDVPEAPYLPEEVLWRQKEQFSDGVGYDWVDGLKDYADKVPAFLKMGHIPLPIRSSADLTRFSTRCFLFLPAGGNG